MNTAAPPTAARPNYGRRRAWTLLGVHLAFAAHIVHWRLAGRTLAPLELNELMYTLEAGIVTAGFLLMVLVTLSVAVFGRFFCSWGCHVLAVQDGSAWLLEKLGLRPKTFRMRALALVPLGALLYMFVWPQVRFVLLDAPRPALRVTDDSSGWASFVTSDFWRNLPGPGIALTTFLVCGTAMVGLMGRRAFCRYGCPYGALFALMDRVAPGRIARIGDCSACGKCTAACTSDVRVHEELEAHGQVVDPACLKDLDCLAACPDGAIGFRFRGSKALSAPRAARVPRKAWMTTRGEELGMALAFVPLLLVFRGLYGLLPFLMSLGLAALTCFLAVIGARLVRARDAALVRRPLKVAGRLTPVGRGAALAIGAWLALVAHSAVLRAAQARGAWIVGEGVHELALARADAATRALRWVEVAGLLETPGVSADLARLAARRGELLAEAGELEPALAAFADAARRSPEAAEPRFNRGRLLVALGRLAEAEPDYREALRLAPDDADAHNNLGHLLLELGRPAEARAELERAVALADLAHAHFNLGRLALEQGDEAAALAAFERAAQRDPAYRAWLDAQLAPAAPPPRTP